MGLRVEGVVLSVLAPALAVFGHIRPKFAQPCLDYMQYMHIYMGGYVCIFIGGLSLMRWAALTFDEPI